MSEAPELPEAKDPFEKTVAVSIAAMAVVLAIISMRGDNAKTDAIIKKNESVNSWAWYQAKSIKLNVAQGRIDLIEAVKKLAPADAAQDEKWQKARAKLEEKIAEYESNEDDIKVEAKKADTESVRLLRVNDRCDLAALCLQIAIVISSVAILARLKQLWYVGIGLGAVGAVAGVSSFIERTLDWF